MFVYWGNEYQAKPKPQQVDLAHAWIDVGTDVVIGHHPHWVQSVEDYNGAPIFYSLGNFIFDQYWSQKTQEGLVVGITIDQANVSAELFPIQIERDRPFLASGEERERLLRGLADVFLVGQEVTDGITQGNLSVIARSP